MIKNNKEDCKWCNQGWTPCDTCEHVDCCKHWVRGHYKTVIFEQDEIPPKGWSATPLPERIEKILVEHGRYHDIMHDQLLALLAEVIDEVVGADEPLPDPLNGFDEYETARINNGLRAEIRERAKDMLGRSDDQN